jgi:hypothetical protein
MKKGSDLSRRITSNGANNVKKTELRSLGAIQKPREGEYPPYAQSYIDLLPDDGLILEYLSGNLKATKKFVASIPRTVCCVEMPKENGPSKRSWGTL